MMQHLKITSFGNSAAYVVAGLFLALNGIKLTSRDAEGVSTFVALAPGDVVEHAFADWSRASALKVTP